MQFLEDMPSKGFQPSGWNEDYAAKVWGHARSAEWEVVVW